MSLFERIQNRILVEKKNKDSVSSDKTSDSQKSKSIYQQPELFDTSKTGKEDPTKDVKTTRDITGDRKKKGRPFGSKNKPKTPPENVQTDLNLDKTDQKTIDQNRKAFRDLQRDKESGISQLNIDKKFNRKTGEYDAKRMREIEGDPKSKTIRQTIEKETDTKIRDFTQTDKNVTKGNETVTQTKKRPLRKGVDFFADPPEVVKARRQKLIQKRKYYEIDRKGNITDKGVEKYARNIKQSNLPLTQKDLDRARKFAVGGEKIKNKAGEVIGTTTGKYGGRLAGTRKPKVKTQTPINQSFINRTKQNRELQRQSRRNQRTTTTNVRKNLGLSDFDQGQIEFDRMFDKSKNKRQIVVNPNKRQQQRKTIELLRQTNRNRTVSDVRTSPKTEVIRKPKVERNIKSFIDKTKQKRELQRQSRLNQRTRTASDVRKNPGLSNYDKGQLQFDKNLEKIKKKIKVDKLSTSGIYDFAGDLKKQQAQQKIKFDKFMTKIKGFKTPKVKPVKTGRFASISKLMSKTKALPKPIRVAALALGTAGAIVGANQLTNTKQKNKDVKPKVVPFTTARKDLVPVTSKLYLGSGNKGGFYKPVKSGLATEKLPNITSAKK